MTKRQVIFGTAITAFIFGAVGAAVEGIGGLKLALGISLMFGMTAYIIAYALSEIDKQTKNNTSY